MFQFHTITYLESTFRCMLRMIGVIQIGEKQQLVLHSVAVRSGYGDSIHAWIVISIPNILMIFHMMHPICLYVLCLCFMDHEYAHLMPYALHIHIKILYNLSASHILFVHFSFGAAPLCTQSCTFTWSSTCHQQLLHLPQHSLSGKIVPVYMFQHSFAGSKQYDTLTNWLQGLKFSLPQFSCFVMKQFCCR